MMRTYIVILCCKIVVVALTVVVHSMHHDRIIHVNERIGNDNEACLKENNTFCQSLEFIAEKLNKNNSQNIKIILNSKVYLTRHVIFEKVKFLSIIGKRRENKILCNCTQGDSKGITFVGIHNVRLYNFGITQCCGTDNMYHATVLFDTCSNVTMSRVACVGSKNSSAVVFVNPKGRVNINRCTFGRNKFDDKFTSDDSYAGGLHVQLSTQTMVMFKVVKSQFFSNKSPRRLPEVVGSSTNWNGFGLGGGMGIALLNNTADTNIYIRKCTFKDNAATWGGGLCIYVESFTFNNNITVVQTSFIHNEAYIGGGGVQVRLGRLESGQNNHIQFHSVKFAKNSAKFGAGLSISANFVEDAAKPGELLKFNNCTWSRNSGMYSPAVDISPCRYQQSNQGYLPIPLFKNSYFKGNFIRKHNRTQSHVTQGVFTITNFFVNFQGELQFFDNWYSALFLTSGQATFENNSNVTFHSNQGIKGGAIAIYGHSALIINDNSHFMFINNSAARVGGGISYTSLDQREYFEGITCFLEYGGTEKSVSERNIVFIFQHNTAPMGGRSIYSESLYSCYSSYFHRLVSAHDLKDIFAQIGIFHFDTTTPGSDASPLATAARNLSFDGNPDIAVVPGGTVSLPLAMYDEFFNIVRSEFALRIEGSESVHLDKYFTVSNSTRVYGSSNQSVDLILSTPNLLFSVEYKVQVTLLPCPPAFFYDKITKSCKCSADYQSHAYPAITKCVDFKAFIKNNHWAGYYPSNSDHPDHFYIAFYPSKFDNSYTGLQLLPNHSNNLSEFMCGSTREGVLCGKCKAGYSAYYHARDITCAANSQLCNFGMIFYLLSELLPTALFVTVVVILGINFSSGSLNGLIFFSQVIDVFTQDRVLSQVYQDKVLFKVLKTGYSLIYGLFNFDFFVTFPFCLWKGATIMDVMAFRYATITFAFVLITFIIQMMNLSAKCCSLILPKRLYRRRQSSVTHGISTVLIICYGQCTKVGFFILAKTYLRGKPGVEPIAVTFYGGLPYFGRQHIPYAIPATIFTIVLVCLPPLCLLVYPLFLHLLELCGLSEHKYVEKAARLLYVSHFIPMFDSFQSCYKDKMCFFAGLYFLYRVIAFLINMYSDSLPPVLCIVVIIGIHSIFHPYKSWRHNVVDSLLFLNITIISCLSMMIKSSFLDAESMESLHNLELIQLAFVYLPFVTCLLHISIKAGKRIYMKCKTLGSRVEQEMNDYTILSKNVSPADHVTHTSIELSKPLILESSTHEYT